MCIKRLRPRLSMYVGDDSHTSNQSYLQHLYAKCYQVVQELYNAHEKQVCGPFKFHMKDRRFYICLHLGVVTIYVK